MTLNQIPVFRRRKITVSKHVMLQASTEVSLSYSSVLVVIDLSFVVVYRLSVRLIIPIIRGQTVEEMGPTGCPETSLKIINQRCVKNTKERERYFKSNFL